ncbi:D-ribose pyranase [Ruminococcus sp. OA3]|uniref:D-ribose pyranase n=1 Tax=Ruminococcus sp. OA3 TaxID=2914164 RepID=UPI001F0558F4|nr:D-ribose pyranase [Ruminococcus sp. OA3]MCH1981515.1 D-ribose pyranase [Ruminococcus sp. OA3]
MKKNGILNSDISRVLSYMGHTDTLAVGDCGLPIPDETERIDLAVKFGVPGFLEVLNEVTGDMKIEKIILAEEIKEHSPNMWKDILNLVKSMGNSCEIEYVSHQELKEQTKMCRAVIRTGETTAYANIILQSGCLF